MALERAPAHEFYADLAGLVHRFPAGQPLVCLADDAAWSWAGHQAGAARSVGTEGWSP